MLTARRHRIVLAAIAGVWTVALPGHGAHAAPPLNRLATQLTHSTDAKTPVASLHLPQSRLDLTAPAMAAPLNERPAAAAFAVSLRRSAETSSTNLPGLGAGSSGRTMSRPEMLARNFRREGLPLARLFQSENALVHVGLSPKGKPGLWFVEKLH